jgi:hypothetical protein
VQEKGQAAREKQLAVQSHRDLPAVRPGCQLLLGKKEKAFRRGKLATNGMRDVTAGFKAGSLYRCPIVARSRRMFSRQGQKKTYESQERSGINLRLLGQGRAGGVSTGHPSRDFYPATARGGHPGRLA